ncbi:MAG TPA: cytochrome c oxidase subunit II, partial [Gaiellaceae bacterium]|nr:cytochrome c oxidase subunit II [Gaiellaceae bacterium]
GGAFLGLGLVVGLLVLSWFRRKRRAEGPHPGERAGWTVVLAGGVALALAVVITVFIASVNVLKVTEAPAASQTRLTIHVIGHQWWWEVRYPGTTAVTANEIHIPVATPVNLVATTADVIHSFWVPELNRKIDTIPDEWNRIELYADETGAYRGQCAEYCGLQHAHMGILVIAQPQAQFRAWLARQEKPGTAPASALQRAGERAFLTGPCQSCHTIRGTSASGYVGPDLTHLAGRSTLAALTIANDPAHLAAWIRDSQAVKPGNQMPEFRLPAAKLRALVAYLEHLK